MKKELELQIGITLPDEFIHILNAFNEKFGGQKNAMDKFLTYLNSSYIVHVDEGRSYENTPIEIEPFITTGGDGIHLGYLILAPELQLKDFPLVSYTSGGGYIDFFGNTTIEGIEQVIASSHSHNSFKEIDIQFLNSIKIFPNTLESYNGYNLINYDASNLIIPPLKVPDNYSYLMTHDGVGVLAKQDLFESFSTNWNIDYSVEDFITKAQISFDNGLYASSLYHLKEGWYFKFYEVKDEIKRLLRDMKIKPYLALARQKYAERLKKEYDWL